MFSHSVMSDSLRPRGLPHSRLPCSSLSPGVCSNSCPLSWWYHPTISSSVIPFSSCPQSFPASGSFPINWLFASSGQGTGASASASDLPMNIQGWYPLVISKVYLLCLLLSPWFYLLAVQETFSIFFSTAIQKHQFFGTQPSLQSSTHVHVQLHLWPENLTNGPC